MPITNVVSIVQRLRYGSRIKAPQEEDDSEEAPPLPPTCVGTRHGPALSSCEKSWGRHCADNNAGAQRYPFFGSFSDIWRSRHSASPGGGTRWVAPRSREDHSDEKITHHESGWSPLRNHPINVRGGQVSDWCQRGHSWD